MNHNDIPIKRKILSQNNIVTIIHFNNYPFHLNRENIELLNHLLCNDTTDLILSFLETQIVLIQNVYSLNPDKDWDQEDVDCEKWFMGLFQLSDTSDSYLLSKCNLSRPRLHNRYKRLCHELVTSPEMVACATIETGYYAFGVCSKWKNFTRQTFIECAKAIKQICLKYKQSNPFQFINPRATRYEFDEWILIRSDLMPSYQ